MEYTIIVDEKSNATKSLISLIKAVAKRNKYVKIYSSKELEALEDNTLQSLIADGMKTENVDKNSIMEALK